MMDPVDTTGEVTLTYGKGEKLPLPRYERVWYNTCREGP